ncbi:PRP28 [[Candida] subhashii]|uniref:RNA helicase n=1 Tax=[Candida] subhashii TaxID=561895 RepID=A0A8J5QRM3_9ASCO|nr:PRP28 [[Candida] subhashii]KAG7665426.1 PRP28 [[Candida] subhashii]
MSKRPKSIDDLLKDDEFKIPKFISKEKRQKLKEQKQPSLPTPKPKPKITYTNESDEDEQGRPEIPTPKSRKNGPRFQFGWDETEDTTSIHTPLISLDDDDGESEDEIDDLPLELHWSRKPLEQMNRRDWRIFKEDFNITTKGQDIPNPLRTWKESNLSQELIDLINKFGYENPTPVQRATIPLSLSKRDVVGVAETGSGKTLAFLIPLLNYLLSVDENYLKFEHHQGANHNQPLGLILTPTRELAQQITQVANQFGKILGFNVICIIGGHGYQETINQVENGVHIIVATPGRLVDSIERNIIGLSKCWYFIMDEADRMIDMGFEKDLNTIIGALPSNEKLSTTIDGRIFNVTKRQTMMFTATISPQIEKITKNYLIDPGYIYIGGAGEALDHIDQKFEYMTNTPNEDFDRVRFDKLLKIISRHIQNTRNPLIIIFANFKQTCDVLSQELAENGYKDNTAIHGSKSQDIRESAIQKFRRHEIRILIATDVAARGIDIPNVTLVINFQMTKKFDEYIHRIGRTGRAGNEGASVTFISKEEDEQIFIPLKKFLVKGGKRLPEWLYSYKSQTMRD